MYLPDWHLVWIRLMWAPWWVRWLVSAFLVAVIVGVLAPLTAPVRNSALGWPWRAVVLGGFGLVVGGLLLALSQPARRVYVAAVDGLSEPDRSRAIRAVRRGDIPDKPPVLAAAIRLGTLSFGRSSPTRQAMTNGFFLVLWAGPAVMQIVGGDIRLGLPSPLWRRSTVCWPAGRGTRPGACKADFGCCAPQPPQHLARWRGRPNTSIR